ncbi:MAG: adenylate kinase [Bryobacteraceae bacterium]
MQAFSGQRIVIVGTSGSGKTFLGRKLSARLNLPHIELDSLHFEANWKEVSTEVFRNRVADAVAPERWIVDGNYSKARDIVWNRADTVIWLDYPLRLIFRRVLGRTARRILYREELWHGNRETARKALFSHDSILLWVLTSYRRNRRKYARLQADATYPSLLWIRFRMPQQTAAWLEAIGSNH